MDIAVVGGTGTLGAHVAGQLAGRGLRVRILSRSSPDYPVDLGTGAGLAAALDGCAAVVDASNATSAKRAEQVLVAGSARLLAAEQEAGVRHHVCISIVGCDRVPVGYYRAKVRQEQIVRQGPVPYSIVRATQFHELVAKVLGTAGRWRIVPTPPLPVQPVAAAEVASVLADVASGDPRSVEVAGPEVINARALAQTWVAVTGRSAFLLPVPLPGRMGRVLRAGALTTDHPDVRGNLTFAAWLQASAKATAKPK